MATRQWEPPYILVVVVVVVGGGVCGMERSNAVVWLLGRCLCVSVYR